jgi:NADH-quinone oxidoreductase subunit H
VHQAARQQQYQRPGQRPRRHPAERRHGVTEKEVGPFEQRRARLGIVGVPGGIGEGFALLVIYTIAGVAETNRAPFDFPEAEQELVSGFNTEYSSVRFALFPQAEYINMVTMAAVATALYLGGWHGPWLPPELSWIWFLLKVSVILFAYSWTRWTVPRYRYDQLMSFGWKWLFPASVINLLVTAALVLYFNA